MKPYRPSNGSEGDWFTGQFCDRCLRDRAFKNGTGAGCEILARTLCFAANDPNYPSEWVEDENGPRCTAFLSDDGDGNRPAPPEPDPSQLVLIADPTEDAATIQNARTTEREQVGVL